MKNLQFFGICGFKVCCKLRLIGQLSMAGNCLSSRFGEGFLK